MLLKKLPDEVVLRVAGMMSGTSFDGIDVAIIDVSGVFRSVRYRVVELCFHPYPEKLKEDLRNFVSKPNLELLCDLDLRVAKEYVNALNACENLPSVELISMHGQTVWHSPRKMSIQIGNADFVAVEIGKEVVSDFRSKDIAVGGEGAPITPYVDYAIFSKTGRIVALNNIGGISNVTVIGEDVLAFDMGPGNALIDLAVHEFFGLDYDKDGRIAQRGKVHEDVVENVLRSDEYMRIPPPKSTGKEHYNLNFLRRFGLSDPYDLVATVTYYTARTIWKSYVDHVLPKFKVERAYFSGGGSRNPVLMGHIRRLLGKEGIDVFVFGKRFSDFKEAIWFAILGSEFARGHFSNLPSVTSATKRVVLGKLSIPW